MTFEPTEEFYIAGGFMALYFMTLCAAAYTGNTILANGLATIGGILGTIAGFFFTKTTITNAITKAITGMKPPGT